MTEKQEEKQNAENQISDAELTTESVVEAVLFASDEPLTVGRLADIAETETKQIREHVQNLNEKYENNSNAFRIEQIAGGYQMLTMGAFNPWLKKLLSVRSDGKCRNVGRLCPEDHIMSRDLGLINKTRLPPPNFESSTQTVTADTKLDIAHGLGVRPKLWQVIMKCNSTDQGYAAGDEILINTTMNSETDQGVVAFADATNITMIQAFTIRVVNLSSFHTGGIDVTKWNYIARAWR